MDCIGVSVQLTVTTYIYVRCKPQYSVQYTLRRYTPPPPVASPHSLFASLGAFLMSLTYVPACFMHSSRLGPTFWACGFSLARYASTLVSNLHRLPALRNTKACVPCSHNPLSWSLYLMIHHLPTTYAAILSALATTLNHSALSVIVRPECKTLPDADSSVCVQR